jgi:hypothetical protein
MIARTGLESRQQRAHIRAKTVYSSSAFYWHKSEAHRRHLFACRLQCAGVLKNEVSLLSFKGGGVI